VTHVEFLLHDALIEVRRILIRKSWLGLVPGHVHDELLARIDNALEKAGNYIARDSKNVTESDT